MLELIDIEIRDFKSIKRTGCFFTTEPGLKFLGGENEVETRLGANGAGKSSFWDAICWVFYGYSIKGGKSSSLIHWGKESIDVSLLFKLNSIKHCLQREGPPNKISLDGKPVTQEELEALIGLSRWRFMNSVIFGQGVPLFPDLSIGDRGELLDEVLNLKLWAHCIEETKDREDTLKAELTSVEKNMAYLEGQAKSLVNPTLRKASVEERLKQLDLAEKELGSITIPTYSREHIDMIHNSLLDFQEKVSKVIDIEHELETIIKETAFFKDNSYCPSCKQNISSEMRKTSLNELEVARTAITPALPYAKRARDIAGEQHEKNRRDMQEFYSEKTRLEERSKSLKSNISWLEKDIAEQLSEIEKADSISAKLAHEISTETLNKAALSRQADSALYWKSGFKRIRLFFIDRILTALSLEIQSALSNLGLIGWQVQLCTESETKSGTTRLGVQIHIKSPVAEGPWDGWSGGETQRLRLGIAMGLASMIQRQAGVDFGFEVWDEPTAWLGNEGVEDLLQALQYRAETRKKSIWVVDHRALASSSFQEIWMAKKTTEGTRIYKVGE